MIRHIDFIYDKVPGGIGFSEKLLQGVSDDYEGELYAIENW